MVFGRIGDVISRLSAAGPQAQLPSSSASLPPKPKPQNHNHNHNQEPSLEGPPSSSGFGFPNPKANLRLSSSLQDLSSYRHRDDEAIHILPFPNKDKEKGKDKPFLSSSSSCLLRLLFIFLCLVFLSLVLYLLALSLWSPTASKYYIVLDSGSTGTRVYVYQASLSPHSDRSTLPILIHSLTHPPPHRTPSARAYDRVETEPGFHNLVHNSSGLKAAIKPLLRWAQNQIPQHAHKTTSVFLYATAGVRRLPRAHSDWLLDRAWSILRASPFLCRREWVKVISGTEEAYFGWIALNHLTDVLGAKPRMPTFGALDLGGSSLQVTFESDQDVGNPQTNLNLRIGKVRHHLTAYSLSGYGLNDAFDKSVVRLFKKLPPKAELSIKHPCLQSGYREKYICSHCADSRSNGSPVVSQAAGKSGISVTLIGAPNWDECSALAKVAVNVSEWSDTTPGLDCGSQPCALSAGLPRPYGQFYAMSGFYVVYRFFSLTSEATLDDVLEKGRGFCERSWEDARNSVAPQPFIEQYCFRAPYIVSLLREGLQIKENQIIIGSGSITWTLGVALLEAGKAFSTRMGFPNYDILQMKINPFVVMGILFVSLILLVCALSCVGNWRPKFLRRPHLPLFRHNSATAASISSPFRFQRWSPIPINSEKMPLSPTSNSEIQVMEFDGFWSPHTHRGQMRLQSRRSQSREDLTSSLADLKPQPI